MGNDEMSAIDLCIKAKGRSLCSAALISAKGAIDMIVVTTETIPGQQIEVLGLAMGSTIQSKNIGHDIGQSFKTLVGGELKSYTAMMDEARNIAIQRMVNQAGAMGADAIVNLRFATSAIMAGAAEVMAYGTAVRFR